MMADRGLYLLGLSEVRRDGSGSEDVGGGYVLAWQGRIEDGSRGAVAFLLSPEAAKAWQDAKAKAKSALSGRILAIFWE